MRIHRTLPSPVCEGSYNEPVSAAYELILVYERHICDVSHHLVGIFVKIKSALFQPLKVCRALDMHVTLKCKRYVLKLR